MRSFLTYTLAIVAVILFGFQVFFSIYLICKPIANFEWLGLVSLNFGLIIITILFALYKNAIKEEAAEKDKAKLDIIKLATSFSISNPEEELSKEIIKTLKELLE